MATGTISNPVTWLQGTVAPPSWFQSVQDNINGWVAGTNPMAALLLSSTINGTTAPTPTPVASTLYKDMIPIAWATVSSAGALVRGVNIATVTKIATGNYDVTLTNAAGTTVLYSIASTWNNLAHGSPTSPVTVNPNATSTSQVSVYSFTSNTGAAVDTAFTILVFGY